jgi:single-strand DNA-binding protein
MFNRIILIGRLTKDPELKYTTNTGVALAKFTLAVDRPFSATRKDAGAGQAPRQKETDFIRIVCWGKLAELCKQHLGRGRLVAIEGRLEIRTWDTPQGERRSMAEVRADDVRFLDKAPHRDGDGGGSGYSDGDQYDGPDEHGGPHPEGGAPRQASPQSGGRKDFGKLDNAKIDEEIDLDDDDPYKEDF